jgi:hypothetical protein
MQREIVLNSTTDVLADVQRAAGMQPTKDALADEQARFEDKLAEAERNAASESQAVEANHVAAYDMKPSQETRPEAREEPKGDAQAEKLERIIDRRIEETLARIPPKPKPVLALPPGPVLFRDWDDAMQSADKTTVLPQWLQDRITKSAYRDVLVYGLARNRQAFDDIVKHSRAGDEQGAFRVLGILEGQFREAAAAQQRRNNLAQAVHQRPRRSARASNPSGTPRHPHAGGPSVGKAASSAPAPVARLRGSSTESAQSIYDPGISQAEYNKLRDEQKAARRRTGYVGREG